MKNLFKSIYNFFFQDCHTICKFCKKDIYESDNDCCYIQIEKQDELDNQSDEYWGKCPCCKDE